MFTEYKPTFFLREDGTLNMDVSLKHEANFIGALSRCAACDRDLGDSHAAHGPQSGVELGTCGECTQVIRDQLFDIGGKDVEDTIDMETLVVDEDDGYSD